jgi:hypothetical protein|tara:strand:+ start:29 stop:634 length:606 start_codon:yes stop_codon:yes gene_type:complete
MKTFVELRKQLDEVNFKSDQKNLELSRTKVKNTEVFYHSEKKGSKKVRVWVKPKSAKTPEELGVFKDMKTAEKSANQFVKLMGEDVSEGIDFLQRVVTHTKTDDMLKEINWLGEVKEFPQSAIDVIAKQTDKNDHNGSVKMLARALGLKKEEKIMEYVAQIHKIERSMSPNLISYRTEIMNRCLKVADKMYSNAKDIHGAF